MKSGAPRRDGTDAAKILRALASAETMTTYTMAQVVPAYARLDRQKAQARVGDIIRAMEKAGLAKRAGRNRDWGWQDSPELLWQITSKGRELIAWWDSGGADTRAAEREAHRQGHIARRAERKRQQEAAAAELAQLQAVYGRGTAREVRQQIARELREQGWPLRRIGLVFGTSGEQIRLDLSAGQYQPKVKVPRVTMGRQGRWPKTVGQMDRDGAMAGLVTVTLTEWE